MDTDHFAHVRTTYSQSRANNALQVIDTGNTGEPGTPGVIKRCSSLEAKKANELKDFLILEHRNTQNTGKSIEGETRRDARHSENFSLATLDGEEMGETKEKKNGESTQPSRATSLISGVPSVPVFPIDIIQTNKGVSPLHPGTPWKNTGVPGVPKIEVGRDAKNSNPTETGACLPHINHITKLDAERNERDRLAGRGHDYAPPGRNTYVEQVSPHISLIVETGSCQVCGDPAGIVVPPNAAINGKRRFCRRECLQQARDRQLLQSYEAEIDILSEVDKNKITPAESIIGTCKRLGLSLWLDADGTLVINREESAIPPSLVMAMKAHIEEIAQLLLNNDGLTQHITANVS